MRLYGVVLSQAQGSLYPTVPFSKILCTTLASVYLLQFQVRVAKPVTPRISYCVARKHLSFYAVKYVRVFPIKLVILVTSRSYFYCTIFLYDELSVRELVIYSSCMRRKVSHWTGNNQTQNRLVILLQVPKHKIVW
jgi:hypothetical protein